MLFRSLLRGDITFAVACEFGGMTKGQGQRSPLVSGARRLRGGDGLRMEG